MDNEFTVYCSNSNWPRLGLVSSMVADLPNGGFYDLTKYEMAVNSTHICTSFFNVSAISIAIIKVDPANLVNETDRIEVNIPDQHQQSLDNLYEQINTDIRARLETEEKLEDWVK